MPSLTPSLSNVLAVAAVAMVMLTGAAAAPGIADAAVSFRSASCAPANLSATGAGSFSLPKPTGAVTGDLLVVTLNKANVGTYDGLAWPDGHGWTALIGTSDTARSYYRFVTAGDPSSYTLLTWTSHSGSTAEIVGAMTAYSGAFTTTPFATAGAEVSGSGASIALPNTTSSYAGSMRVSIVAIGDDRTNSFSSGLTEDCDVESGADVGISSAHEPVGVGTTPSRTATQSGSGVWVAQTYVINSVPPCGTGGVNPSWPGSIAFPAVTLDGTAQTSSTTATLTIDDQTASGAGWHLDLTSTAFANGGYRLPDDATSITGVTPSAGAGRCSAPVNAVSYPVIVPAGAAPPTATRIFEAAAGSGAGPTNLAFAMALSVPAVARKGSYGAEWTFTVSSGP